MMSEYEYVVQWQRSWGGATEWHELADYEQFPVYTRSLDEAEAIMKGAIDEGAFTDMNRYRIVRRIFTEWEPLELAPVSAPAEQEGGRPFADFRTEGILWAINVHVFHPRGFALALHFDDETGEATGWSILGDGTEPWVMQDGPYNGALFRAFEELLS
jgi:hypothetical protein